MSSSEAIMPNFEATKEQASPQTDARSKSGQTQRAKNGGRSATETPQRDKEGRLPACEECRTRKVKCDALLPECTPCQKSGRECIGRDKMPNVSRSLIYDLQQKVKLLEGKLAAAASSSDDGAEANKRGRRKKRRLAASDNCSDDDDSDSDLQRSSPMSPQLIQPSPNDLVQQSTTIFESLGTELTSPNHQRAPTHPSHRSVQSLNDDEATAIAALTKYHRERNISPTRLKRRSSSTASRQRLSIQSGQITGPSRADVSSVTADTLSRSRSGRFVFISAYDRSFYDLLISKYLNYINGALPVFNQVRLRQIAAQVFEEDDRLRSALDTGAYTNSMPPPPSPAHSQPDRASATRSRYLILMVMAIALASLGRRQHQSSDLRRLGHQYWLEAQSIFSASFRCSDLDKLRATLLQLQYACLVPTAGSVWELSGAAVRLITELNLHFDRDYDASSQAQFSSETIDMRRRLFWTSYCLDRSLAVALARPPGLSDAWIHVQLPSLLSDAEIVRLDSDPASKMDNQVDPLKKAFHAHIALRRIQSEVLCRLHSVNPRDYSLDHESMPMRQSLAIVMNVGPPTPNVEWQTRIMAMLGDWKAESDQSSMSKQGLGELHPELQGSNAAPFVTQDWIDLNYHLTASLLFRPSPNNPRPDQNGLRQAFIASGHAMRIYKNMHRNMTINFPWLATHHLFISGLTHLNSLEKLSRSGVPCPQPIVDIVFNIQGCASTLQALTSRDDGYGARIRDTFDNASSAVLRTVLDPSRQPSSHAYGNASGPAENFAGSTARNTSALDALLQGASGASSPFAATPRSTSHAMEAETEPGRRASHHEAMLQATQHPTWLSDATWNSINSIDSAPPPGSTILVAAPPRPPRHNNFIPTSSDRSTQNMFSSQQISDTYPSTMTQTSGDNTYGNHSPMPSNLVGQGNLPREDLPQSYPTFGFHDYLLQPYDGAADIVSFPLDESPAGGMGGAAPTGALTNSSYMLAGSPPGLSSMGGAKSTPDSVSLKTAPTSDADAWLQFIPLMQGDSANQRHA